MDLVELAKQGGITLVLVGGFFWLIRTVGLALVASIRDLNKTLDDHTKVDLEHHGHVRNELAEMRGELLGAARERSKTPIEGVPIRTTPAPGRYDIRRKPTQGDE